MKLTFILCLSIVATVLAEPVSVRVGFRSSGRSDISQGPGFLGAPLLVDTSSHMRNLYRGRSNSNDVTIQNHDKDVTISVRSKKDSNDNHVDDVLPIIRPATNVHDPRDDGMANLFLSLLRAKIDFITSMYESGDQVSNNPVQVVDEDQPTRVEVKVSKDENKITNDDTVRFTADQVRMSLQSQSKRGALSFLRPRTRTGSFYNQANDDYNDDDDDELPIIRSATNVKQKRKFFPIIRPATNV